MDAEKETLLQATLSLQDQLKESQVALLVEQVCSLRYLYLLSLIHFFSCNIMNFGNFCTMMRAVSYNLHPLCNDSQCETSFTVELLILELGAKMVSILAMPNLDPSFSTKMSRNFQLEHFLYSEMNLYISLDTNITLYKLNIYSLYFQK